MALMTVLAAPLALLNTAGGIVSGLWLVVLGEWWAVLLGLVSVFFSHYLISIALSPGWALGALGFHFSERGKNSLMHFLLVLSGLYHVAAITAWCGLVLYVFASQANSQSIIPLLLLSYSVAIGPLVYLMKLDQQGNPGLVGSMMTTFFAQIGYVAMLLVVFFSDSISIVKVLTVFLSVMLFGLLVNLGGAVLEEEG